MLDAWIKQEKKSMSYLIMTQFKKVSPKVYGNAAKKVDKRSNDPLSHGFLHSDAVKKSLHAGEIQN